MLWTCVAAMARPTAAKLPYYAVAVGEWDRETNGWTDRWTAYHHIDHAPHTMRAVSITD